MTSNYMYGIPRHKILRMLHMPPQDIMPRPSQKKRTGRGIWARYLQNAAWYGSRHYAAGRLLRLLEGSRPLQVCFFKAFV